MKRMESKIAVTFAIMFVVGVIINGLYNVISTEESFFSWRVMFNAMLNALFYLSYVWLNTRRHKTLAQVGFVGIALLILFYGFSSLEGVSGTFSFWSWKDTVLVVYYFIAYAIASHQAEELLKEEKKRIITVVYKGEQRINLEDFDVTIG